MPFWLMSQSNRNGTIQKACLTNNSNINVSIILQSNDLDFEQLKSIEYTIPTVVHVFHDGLIGKLSNDQVYSGIQTINLDFNGQNEDWYEVESTFESIKAKLKLNLCLVTKDEFGNASSGIIYYDDYNAAYNQKDLTQYGWDNYKYLNIYLPIYAYGEPSDRTAYANLPERFSSSNGLDGIFYSSVRWGYGEHSELEVGDGIASIATHEMGHWLGLYHTFRNGCISSGDLVDDTPALERNEEINFKPCSELSSQSCDGIANISNYMDYNHGCKKMFTKGQVERMLSSLQLPERKPIWSIENLVETGCLKNMENLVEIIYSRIEGTHFIFKELPLKIELYDINGRLFLSDNPDELLYSISKKGIPPKLYFASIIFEKGIIKRKFFLR